METKTVVKIVVRGITAPVLLLAAVFGAAGRISIGRDGRTAPPWF